ncbi:transmembrane protein 42-like [Centruroides sculpturatus]|uniref:transmembrane protein 42-like n=1 Tax=Centruroides sculpturatus TaxID=218467 RepID=UPI000C6E3DFD|nr:transmembrane protein 42-like [Centruroides sculpturatus]XP_023228936.1 transmembrane protein 42-like [Centruroides sculpturatus]XP_023228937.1 transmembrane protein 42-like [Centruroides sculpturatus]XP_023228938.1 transmembrane protein 42-like [Centruroides sculpturatus]XP_023228939.1 transmembrane protein 42-like [Centruroides sculpturatus]
MKGVTVSLFSGLLAALASLFGKFSMASEEALYLCEVSMEFMSSDEHVHRKAYHNVCNNVLLLVQIGFFLLMLLSNALMWTLFTKALQLCATTLEATVTNTAANFFFTAIFGQVFFGETLTFLWWLGTMMIIVGLLLMHKGNQRLHSNVIKVSSKQK